MWDNFTTKYCVNIKMYLHLTDLFEKADLTDLNRKILWKYIQDLIWDELRKSCKAVFYA